MEQIYFYKKITDKTKIGEVTDNIIGDMKEYGIKSDNFDRIKTVLLEAEKNIKLYAESGEIEVNVQKNKFKARVKDKGPGIENIGLAFQDGYTTANTNIKEMGYGLGRGLTVIQENSDDLNIASEIGVGTTFDIEIGL